MTNSIFKLINRPALSDPKKQAVISLILLGNFVTREMEKVIKRTGITLPQYNALRVLRVSGKDGNVMYVKDVKKRMIFKETDISRLLARLYKKGMINCKIDPKDKRAQM